MSMFSLHDSLGLRTVHASLVQHGKQAFSMISCGLDYGWGYAMVLHILELSMNIGTDHTQAKSN